jgi:hypothetical protein
MEINYINKKNMLEQRIPEIKKTLKTVEFLIEKKAIKLNKSNRFALISKINNEFDFFG